MPNFHLDEKDMSGELSDLNQEKNKHESHIFTHLRNYQTQCYTINNASQHACII